MIIQAELKCKQTRCEADPCAVDKVIELPSQRFQQFSRALLAELPEPRAWQLDDLIHGAGVCLAPGLLTL